MQTLGFDSYVEPLRVYLQKYREVSVRNYGFQIFQCQLFEPVVFLLLAKSFQLFKKLLAPRFCWVTSTP